LSVSGSGKSLKSNNYLVCKYLSSLTRTKKGENMRVFSKIAVAVAVLPVLAFASPVFADSPGQLEGGTINYVVKNNTQKGAYATSASAACGEEVRFSIRLHNTSFGGFTNVNVAATLPSAGGTSNMTATTDLGGISGTTGTTTVTLTSGGTLAYENGSTVLYDENSNVIKTLPDTITTSGVSIGALNGSTTEFVNFNAKVNCPSTPPVTPPTTTVTKTVVVGKTLPNTGAGDVVGIVAGASAAGSAVHYAVASRRNRR
jgi:hypothetical protein